MTTRLRIILGSALLLAFAAPAYARTQTYFGFQIGIVGAPPPPRVVFYEPPPVFVEPGTRVYVVNDDDCDYDVFRYGPCWYMSYGGYWYRAPRYRGPFTVVDVRFVPRPIFYVPGRHWKHHEWEPRRISSREWRPQRISSRGHGHGHGHGHGD